MSKMIFVNLPVDDLPVSQKFYEALGFANNPAFSDKTAACMVWSDAIYVMLLSHAKWRSFTSRPIPDRGSSEVALAINFESVDAVNAVLDMVAAHGGTPDINPPENHGFMYQRSFADPDGHVWEPFWMDAAAAASGPPDLADTV